MRSKAADSSGKRWFHRGVVVLLLAGSAGLSPLPAQEYPPPPRLTEIELRNLVALPAADFLPELMGGRLHAGRRTVLVDPAADPIIANNSFRHLLRRTTGVMLMEEEIQGVHFNAGFRGITPNNGLFARVYQDGFPLHVDVFGTRFVASVPDANQVTQMQVIPAGTGMVFGPHPGGAIDFLSYEPAGDQPWRIRNTMTLGSHDYRSNLLEVSGTSGEYSYALFGRHAEGDGFGVQPGFDNGSAGLRLVRRFADRAALTLSLQHYRFSSDQISGVARATSGVNNLLNYYFQDSRRLAAEALFERDFSPSARLESRVWHHATRGRRDFTPTGILGEARDRIRYSGTETRFVHRAPGAAAAERVLTAGLVVQGSEGTLVSSANPAGANRLDLDRDDFNWAVFAEGKHPFHERFSATLGLRYEHAALAGRGFRGTGDVDRRFRDDELLYAVGIEADILAPTGIAERPLVWYAHAGSGYRPPTYNETVNQGFGTIVPDGLRNAAVQQFETGLRSQPAPWYRADLSGFWMDFDDQFATVAGVVQNAGRTRHQGVEWFQEVDVFGWLDRRSGRVPATAVRLGPRSPQTETGLARNGRLNIHTAVSWLDATVEESPFATAVGVAVPYAPEWSAQAGVGYNRFERFKAIVNVRYVGAHLGNVNNDDQLLNDNRAARIPSYAVWDAAVEYSFGSDRFTLFANLNNAFDRRYVSGIQGGSAADNRILAPGRNVYGGLRLTF